MIYLKHLLHKDDVEKLVETLEIEPLIDDDINIIKNFGEKMSEKAVK